MRQIQSVNKNTHFPDQSEQLILKVQEKVNTERRQKQTIEKLNREIKVLTSDLKKINKKIKEFEATKSGILANISHDLRTPLNTISGFCHLLSKTQVSERQCEYLHNINISIDTLLALIQDIVDLGKIDDHTPDLKRDTFSLRKTLQKVLLEAEKLNFNKSKTKISFELDENLPQVISGDEHQLIQALVHLLKYVLKFTTTGDIQLSVRVLKRKKNIIQIHFIVYDSEISISKSKIQDALDNRKTQASESHEFIDLGLMLVKQLVKCQGGDFVSIGKKKTGSVYALWLPFRIPQQEVNSKIKSLKSEKAKLSDKKILVVEDNYLNRIVIKNLLENIPGSTTVVENGKEALEELKANQYDIILMDLQMPVMDGCETARIIRNGLNERARNITIIAMTAHDRKHERKMCFQTGMDDYITKPLDPELLQCIVEKYLI